MWRRNGSKGPILDVYDDDDDDDEFENMWW
jgi:hypothetical protein